MGNVHMEATQINYRGGSKKMSVEEAIKNAGSEITPEEKAWIDTIPELASQEIIAPEFDAEEGVYAVGDLVIYQGGLYQFTTAHETAGAWNPEEVAAVKVSEALSSLESGLTDVNNKLTTLIWEGNFPSTEGSNITVDALATSTLLVLVNSDGVAMLGTAFYGSGGVLTYNATTITSYAYQYYITNDGKTLNVNVNAKGCYDSNGNAKAITKIYKLM